MGRSINRAGTDNRLRSSLPKWRHGFSDRFRRINDVGNKRSAYPSIEDLEYLGEMNEISYSTKSTVEEYLKQNTLRHENILQPVGYYRQGFSGHEHHPTIRIDRMVPSG